MNVIGERVRVLASTDPTMAGMTGVVVLETANTIVVDRGGAHTQIQKSGSTFLLTGSGKIVAGIEIVGRLQDRLGRRPR